MSPSKIQRLFGFYKHKIKDVVLESGSLTIEFHRTLKEALQCPKCANTDVRLYGKTLRTVRDLSACNRIVFLKIHQNKIYCTNCGVHAERISFLDHYARHTRRFEQFIHKMCHFMTINDVAHTFKLGWHEVKNIDKKYLAKKYLIPSWKNLRILGVDEIALSRGHKYLTIVVNLKNGQVIYVSKDRKESSLKNFFERLGPHRCRRIKAIAMDLWKPYTAAARDYLPKAKIVYDKFHLLAEFSRTIDKIRRSEYAQASKDDQDVIKGSKYLLFKHKESLSDKQQAHLSRLLSLNFTLNTTYILKDDLYQLWNCPNEEAAEKHIQSWIQKAKTTAIKELISYAKMLSRHMHGILNYFDFPITTAKVEGINNKIKVLKRKAYGYRDILYFELKIYDLHNLASGYG